MLRLINQQLSRISYTRQYLQELAVDQQAVRREEGRAIEQERTMQVLNLRANDKNPHNYISVKINHPVHRVNPSQSYVKKKFWLMEPKPLKIHPDKKKTITATRKYIISSIKKAKEALFDIKQRHIMDAINILQQSHKKVAKVMVGTFQNIVKHAAEKNLNPSQVWIHGCIIGKTKRYQSVRFHAKGKGARQKRDFIQVKVIAYEKNIRQFYEEIAAGETAPGVGAIVRQKLLEKDAGYAQLSGLTCVTTAKGRQQAREIIKRKVDRQMIHNQQNNTYKPKKLIRTQILREEGSKIREKLKMLQEESIKGLLHRQRHMEQQQNLKNQQISQK